MDLLVQKKTTGDEPKARPRVMNDTVFGNLGGDGVYDVLDSSDSNTWQQTLDSLKVKTDTKTSGLSTQQIIQGAAERQNVFVNSAGVQNSPKQEVAQVAENKQPESEQPNQSGKPGDAITVAELLNGLKKQEINGELAVTTGQKVVSIQEVQNTSTDQSEAKPKNKGGRPAKARTAGNSNAEETQTVEPTNVSTTPDGVGKQSEPKTDNGENTGI